jgi:hypothetical protein
MKMEETKWLITFYNGYCGCDIEEKFEGTRKEAEAWADEHLPEYAEDYTHIAFGWNEEYTEEEYEEYLEDCSYDITPLKDDD